ncbi:uncharacterized protein LOC108672794 [Hyalella azteca]|uniref:Uncharacterized protein LOC108672794 n=1 Tax=Hyalella azteca TaxID=294128 RepID=A0A8B7NQQ2_HYAAZ|nr:uncharacterized protein LOC108672794 [Hyalella azteca]
MAHNILIRPVTEEDCSQVVQLSREVQRDMAVDIVVHQLRFVIRHPWPYTMMAVFTIIVHTLTEWSVIQSIAVGLSVTLVEETIRFLVFFSKWVDIFQAGDDVINVLTAFAKPKGQFLVAVVDGRVVATAGVKQSSRPDIGVITRFFIQKNFRGIGLGTRLLSAAKKELRDIGCRSAELLTHHSNVPALNFYYKHGFRKFNVIHYANVYPYVYDQYELSRSLTDVDSEHDLSTGSSGE